MNAVATLRSAEADLVTALSSAADSLDAVGTSALDAALARLEAAAETARARLAGAMCRMNAIISGVTAAIEGQAAALRADLCQTEATPETPPLAIAEPAVTSHTEAPAGYAAPDADDVAPSDPTSHSVAWVYDMNCSQPARR